MSPKLRTSRRADARGAVPGRRSVLPGTCAVGTLALLACAALLPACRAAGADSAASAPAGRVVPRERQPQLPTALVPALDALRAAVEDGEDETAEAILAGLRVRAGNEREVARLLDGFERVLAGRRLVRSLDLVLRLEPRAGAAETAPRFRLLLDAHHERAAPLTFRLPPASLERLVVSIDPRGIQTKSFETRTLPAFEALTLEPGTTRSVTLLDYELRTGTALAVREQWRLRLHSGSVQDGEVELPAAGLAAGACEHVVLATFLPPEPVEPAVLVEYVQREEVYPPPLLERAVRILPERRVEALELLLPVVEGFERERPERIDEIAPALSWLLRVTDGGPALLGVLKARDWARADAAEEARGRAPSGGRLELRDGTVVPPRERTGESATPEVPADPADDERGQLEPGRPREPEGR